MSPDIARKSADNNRRHRNFQLRVRRGGLPIAVQSDGKILLGGDFSTLAPNGGAAVTRNRIARLNADGTLDTAFNPNASNEVRSIAVQSDGRILLGGAFTTIGGVSRNLFARLSNDTAALSTLTVTKTTVTLTRNGSAAQFTRVLFEQSIDNGATYTPLGTAANSFAAPAIGKGDNQFAPLAPQAAGYTLTGLNLPDAQNILIRARGFYRTGYQNGSETTEDKVQTAYLLAPTGTSVTVSGRALTYDGRGISGAVVTLNDSDGNVRTTLTGKSGAYHFDEISTSVTCVITIRAKRFTFSEPTIVRTLTEDTADVDFIARAPISLPNN